MMQCLLYTKISAYVRVRRMYIDVHGSLFRPQLGLMVFRVPFRGEQGCLLLLDGIHQFRTPQSLC